MTKHTIHTYSHVPGDISDCKYTYGRLYIQAEGHINHRQCRTACKATVSTPQCTHAQTHAAYMSIHTQTIGSPVEKKY